MMPQATRGILAAGFVLETTLALQLAQGRPLGVPERLQFCSPRLLDSRFWPGLSCELAT